MGKSMEEICAFLMPEQTAEQQKSVMDEISREEVVTLCRTGGRIFDGLA